MYGVIAGPRATRIKAQDLIVASQTSGGADALSALGTAKTRRRLAKQAREEPTRRVLVLSVVRPQNARAAA